MACCCMQWKGYFQYIFNVVTQYPDGDSELLIADQNLPRNGTPSTVETYPQNALLSTSLRHSPFSDLYGSIYP